jgi:oligopeptide/dipeptide ABC transporter ATP-binding protein
MNEMINLENQTLLKMCDVNVSFFTGSTIIRAVDNVSLHINRGEIFGLVGESGSGKTMTALSIMRLVPPPGKIMGGKILFEGNDLLQLSDNQMEAVRGRRISIIFQEPMTSLNPVLRVGDQVAEIILIHSKLVKRDAEDNAITLLKNVGFYEPEKKYIQYPHQLSGGQRQRILIAISIACNPSLIIADEPTTALDVATEGEILCLLQDLVQKNQMSMLFITHNLHVIKSLGTRIGIMYAGRIVEENMVNDFFREPMHPYSKGLLETVMWLKGTEKELKSIPGFVPKLSDLPQGCKFHPRCKYVMPKCKIEEPPYINVGDNKWLRCYLFQN